MIYPRVSIIILNWNGWEDTVECLESIYQINYPVFDVIVIDNNSEDNSIAKIRDYCEGKINVSSKFSEHNPESKPIKLFEYTNLKLASTEFNELDKFFASSTKKLILIKNVKNYGFAEGNNIGIEFVTSSLGSDYVLLLNNDTVVDKEFLTELVKVSEDHGDVGFVGPKVYIYNQKNILQVAGGSTVDLKHGEVNEIAYHYFDEGKYDHYFEPDFVGGTCILIKKELIENVGLLDTNFFMYWEDADWCFRGRKYGYKSSYAYKSKIWHKYGASSGTPFRMYYFTRNRIYFVKKNVSNAKFAQFIVFLAVVTIYKSFIQLIRFRDFKMSRAFIKGFYDGLIVSLRANNM
jgi:GT2 family glycosyltransferase